jgi:hypothetical protein
LQREPVSGNGNARPRIVVPVDRPASQTLEHHFVPENQPGRVTVSVPRKEAPPSRPVIPAVSYEPRKRGRSFVVGAILVLTFAGLLLATGAYVRARWNRQQAAQQQQQNNQTISVGREGVTTTDVNLRSDPSTANDSIGLAESGSRVRILSIANNWCEVQVLQHARQKKEPNSSDRGWVNKRFLRFD